MYRFSHIMLILVVGLMFYSFAVACIAIGWPGWIALAVVLLKLVRKRGKTLTTLASGRFAAEDEMRRAGMINGKGLILGRLPRKKLLDRFKAVMSSKASSSVICKQFFGKPEIITLPPSTVHVSAYSPTGGGKNASLISLWLLNVNESAVVVDYKGESALLVAGVRKRMGRALSSIHFVSSRKHRTLTTHSIGSTRTVLGRMTARRPRRHSFSVPRERRATRFYSRAEARVAAVTGTTVYHGKPDKGSRSLLHVANLLSNPKALEAASTLMQQHPEVWGGGLARMGGQIGSGAAEELASVSGTVTTAIDFMNSPDVAESLKAPLFDPRDLYQRKCTIFLVLPPEYMRSHAALLRMWIIFLAGVVIRGGLNSAITFISLSTRPVVLANPIAFRIY